MVLLRLLCKIRVHVHALSSTDFFDVIILMHPCEVAGPLIKVTLRDSIYETVDVLQLQTNQVC